MGPRCTSRVLNSSLGVYAPENSSWSYASSIIEFSLFCVLLPIFVVIGLFFNSLLLHIFLSINFKVRAYRMLKYSTISNLFLNVFTIAYPILDKYGKTFGLPFYKTFVWSFYVGKISFVVKNFFSRFSAFNIMILAVDRYLIISHTSKYLAWRHSCFFRYCPLIIAIFVLSFSAPITKWYSIVPSKVARACKVNVSSTDNTSYVSSINATTVLAELLPFGHEEDAYRKSRTTDWTWAYRDYTYIRECLVSQIPTLILLVLSFIVLKSMIKASRKSPTSSTYSMNRVSPSSLHSETNGIAAPTSNSILGAKLQIGLFRIPPILEEEYWLTVLLFVSACLHVICIVPLSIVNIIFSTKINQLPSSSVAYTPFTTIVDVANFLELIKPCIDSAIYIYVCPKLRLYVQKKWQKSRMTGHSFISRIGSHRSSSERTKVEVLNMHNGTNGAVLK